MCMCVCMCMHICMCMCICMYVYVYVYVYVSVYLFVCVYVCACMCTRVTFAFVCTFCSLSRNFPANLVAEVLMNMICSAAITASDCRGFTSLCVGGGARGNVTFRTQTNTHKQTQIKTHVQTQAQTDAAADGQRDIGADRCGYKQRNKQSHRLKHRHNRRPEYRHPVEQASDRLTRQIRACRQPFLSPCLIHSIMLALLLSVEDKSVFKGVCI